MLLVSKTKCVNKLKQKINIFFLCCGGYFMDKKTQKFFLGANSCEGFVSAFADSYKPTEGWRSYVIKGGPGTGKSSFMKHFAVHAEEQGEEVILCPCSSDPNSLDGVILPGKKAVILDGTAPHVVEPKWPGVCEEIVNLGDFWNGEKLRESAEEIFEVSNKNSRLHRKASGYLKAAGQVLAEELRFAVSCTDEERCKAFAERICRKLLPNKRNGKGKEWVRFLQGVTPLGLVSYTDSINEHYAARVIISDPFGGVSGVIMQVVREYALAAGYEIITVKNAFLPGSLIDHVLIPELSLAFVTENSTQKFGGEERRVHARRFMNVTQLHAHRQRTLFSRRVARELISAACATLKEAKATHDELEKYYIAAMDFEAVTDFAEKFVKRELGK